ncbi:MAG: phosphoadenosine phosphosulfate reductase [Firmicutes bacterium ZCTH02-B6]|nr:MAG: phosphoadenosine phosphosulfate reductase [Firmicutes bacterium ZCTH02-B6]
MESWEPEQVLLWAVERFPSQVAMTCSFAGAGTVLAHMLHRHGADVPILFLDTGFHFAETLQFKREFAGRFGLRVIDIRPALTVAEQERQWGAYLYDRDPDLCCRLRKVEPLSRALVEMGVKAWVTALRRDQSETRRRIQILELHEVAPDHEVVKIHPLANWTRRDVWRYIERHGLPYHPLLDDGYASIGCWPCTERTLPGAGERSGRWPGKNKTECGLHTFSRRLAAAAGGTLDAERCDGDTAGSGSVSTDAG